MTCDDGYAARMIEQGNAIPAPAAITPKPVPVKQAAPIRDDGKNGAKKGK